MEGRIETPVGDYGEKKRRAGASRPPRQLTPSRTDACEDFAKAGGQGLPQGEESSTDDASEKPDCIVSLLSRLLPLGAAQF